MQLGADRQDEMHRNRNNLDYENLTRFQARALQDDAVVQPHRRED
jgi:hypothetical protein